MNPFTDIIDPDSLDYSRGVKIIRDPDGKLHFRPLHTPAEPESFEEWLKLHDDAI